MVVFLLSSENEVKDNFLAVIFGIYVLHCFSPISDDIVVECTSPVRSFVVGSLLITEMIHCGQIFKTAHVIGKSLPLLFARVLNVPQSAACFWIFLKLGSSIFNYDSRLSKGYETFLVLP